MSKEPMNSGKTSRGKTARAVTPKQLKEEETAQEPAPYDDAIFRRMSKALTHNEWYHGLMPRDEIEDLLVENGDFLVRKTEVQKHPRYAVSVMNEHRIRHILINYKNDVWYLRELKKPTLTELIETHVNEKVPVMADGTVLVRGIPRPDFYILHEHVDMTKRLGGGAFGEVFMGVLRRSDTDVIDVAVKKLKGTMAKKKHAEFIKEAKLSRRFVHQNIVKVHGVAVQEEPVLIILELAPGGSLQHHLRKPIDLSAEKLIGYTRDAARGMCYLSGRHVIHRDIAARNCLLGKNDEVKISDFGLSVADRNCVKMERLKHMPVKWLAPETLKLVFTRCKTEPFPGDTNHQAKEKILSGDLPMKLPSGSPANAVRAMELCFTYNPDDRPEFDAIFKILAPGEAPPEIDKWGTYNVD
ncbi:TK/FER protein kinase [Aphelenchoides avenae]|nr:TK/FER protein kinase [Aphelenchus avenae]